MSKTAKTQIFILLLSAILVACLIQGEFLLLPKPLGYLGWVFYRAAFCVALPPRVVAMLFFPMNSDHIWPPSHWIALAVIMPIYLEMLRLAWRRFTRQYNIPTPLMSPLAAPALLDPAPVKKPKSTLKSETGENPQDFRPERRAFLLSAAAGSLGVVTGGVGGYAAFVEPGNLRIRQYTIPIRGLPAELAGLRLIHVSDTHYGPFVPMRMLENAVETINRLNGDLVVLTGDYVHRTHRSLKPGIGVLGGIKARLGSVAVLGNHDHWEGTRECYAAFDRIGIPLLDNRHLCLAADGIRKDGRFHDGRTLCLAGVGDLWEDEVSFKKALGDVPGGIARLVLGHNPDVAEMIDPALRVDLLLSGHTHGGQIALPLLGPPKVGEYGYKYIGGHCQGPACPVIVSRGVGMSGLPLRLNVPPEIGVITLVQA